MSRLLSRIAAFALLIYLLGFAVFAVSLPRPAGRVRADAIVVLTGGSGRLERGFALLRSGAAPRLFISGVDPSVRPVELAASYRVDRRLFDCCVELGRESVDTRSNADEVVAWARRRRVRTIRLVTNDIHMARAGYEIEARAGDRLRVIDDAVATQPRLTSIFLEYNKFIAGRGAALIGL